MKLDKLALSLTVVNLAFLFVNCTRVAPVQANEAPPMLRGRGLEIVDDQGRLRAQIVVNPPSVGFDGKKDKGNSLFRLIDVNGRPAVKIGGSDNGSGMSLAGDSEKRDWSGIQVLANGPGCEIKMIDRAGKEAVMKP